MKIMSKENKIAVKDAKIEKITPDQDAQLEKALQEKADADQAQGFSIASVPMVVGGQTFEPVSLCGASKKAIPEAYLISQGLGAIFLQYMADETYSIKLIVESSTGGLRATPVVHGISMHDGVAVGNCLLSGIAGSTIKALVDYAKDDKADYESAILKELCKAKGATFEAAPAITRSSAKKQLDLVLILAQRKGYKTVAEYLEAEAATVTINGEAIDAGSTD